MKSTISTNAGNDSFSGKPTTPKTVDTTKSAGPATVPGAAAEPDRRKSTNGKTGFSTITIYPMSKDSGRFRSRFLLESQHRNRSALQSILARIKRI